jgi:hypothetical protein
MGIYGNYINEVYSKNKKMYFISPTSMDNKVLTPRIPDNYFTKNNYEDNVTKRVCFAPSVDKCLMGLSMNLKDKEFFAHIPIEGQQLNIVHPSVKQVPDSKITGEIWVTNPVKIKCIGRIRVTGDSGKDGHKFKYGEKYYAELYDWDYEWIEKY